MEVRENSAVPADPEPQVHPEDGIDDVVEELDIEASATLERKPRAKAYRIRIDKQHFVIRDAQPTGLELLTLAGKSPASNYMLFIVEHGGHSHEIGLTDHVNLTKPGVEKFRTLPRDQQEG